MVNDAVADTLTRIRNAGLRHAEGLEVPASRYREAILAALVRTGYLTGYVLEPRDGRPVLVVRLKYIDGLHAIAAIRQLSKQSLRRYSSYKTLRSPRRGGGILLLSTPLGILSDREARQRGVGGELICEIHS